MVERLLIHPPDDVDERLFGVTAVRVGAVTDPVERASSALGRAIAAGPGPPARRRTDQHPGTGYQRHSSSVIETTGIGMPVPLFDLGSAQAVEKAPSHEVELSDQRSKAYR